MDFENPAEVQTGTVTIPLEYYEKLKSAADIEAKQTDAKHLEVKNLQDKSKKLEQQLEFYFTCFAIWTRELIGAGLSREAYEAKVRKHADDFNAKGTVAEFTVEIVDKKVFIKPLNKTEELL